MGAEQKISASVFTHRGDGFSANTNSFILDGRYPHEFELDNSHVSIANTDKSFFFAVCDTKQTDYLNESVAGIKELRKLSTQFKSTSRDIRARTEALGECLVETENLLYDTASYPDDIAVAPAHGASKPHSSTDRRQPARGQDAEADEEAVEGGASGDGGEGGGEGGDGGSGEYNAENDGDQYGQGGDAMDGQEFSEDDDLPEPGSKGFSSVGFILNETKGSILAQGACTALLLRDGALRIVSGGARRGGRGDGIPAGYGGRASAVFELRDEDVFLLCTTTILNAIGEESVDSYLAMQDDVAVISATIMRDAVQTDPSANMTCMVVRIEEIREEEEEVPNALTRRQPDYRYVPPTAGRPTQPTVAAASPYLAQPEYQEQDPRMVQAPTRVPLQYPAGDTFTRRATTRFQSPPKPLSFGGNRTLLISVAFTFGLFAILITSLYFFNRAQNPDQLASGATSPRPTQTTSGAAASQPTSGGENIENGDNGYDDLGFEGTTQPNDDPIFTTTPSTTTQSTTTEPPVQVNVVRAGDTLSKIAQQYYNASRYYPLIKEANNLETDIITIGQNLIIPPRPTSTPEPAPDADGDNPDSEGNVTAPRTSTQ